MRRITSEEGITIEIDDENDRISFYQDDKLLLALTKEQTKSFREILNQMKLDEEISPEIVGWKAQLFANSRYIFTEYTTRYTWKCEHCQKPQDFATHKRMARLKDNEECLIDLCDTCAKNLADAGRIAHWC